METYRETSKQALKYDELAEELNCSSDLIRKTWHTLPHYFISETRTLRSARFDLKDVLDHLKEENYSGPFGKLLARRL